jgi:hypothetical protein
MRRRDSARLVVPESRAVTQRVDAGRSPRENDLIENLAELLSDPLPRILLVKGAPGSGKSSLIRQLAERLSGPKLYAFYRAAGNPSGSSPNEGGPGGGVSLLIVDPETQPLPEIQGASLAALPISGEDGSSGGPQLVLEAVQRLAKRGGGLLVVDSWDRATEAQTMETGTAPVSHSTHQISSESVGALREQLGQLPVRCILAMVDSGGPGIESVVDGIIDLGEDDWDGPFLRVANIPKFRAQQPIIGRHPFTLEGGRFYSPMPRGGKAALPIGSPDPDPEPTAPDLWPGAKPFAEAFGRIPAHAIIGIETPVGLPPTFHLIFSLPLAAHILRSGGRVVWIPSSANTPAGVVKPLLKMVPPEFLRERLRVISASGLDPGLGELKSVILPVRTEAGQGGDLQSATARPVMPFLTDAYQFLAGAREGTPSLMVLALDGLNALASVGGFSYSPTLFPVILSKYRVLPGFRGFGVGASDDPLAVASFPSLDIHLRLRERHGRLILYGVNPATPAYILDWPSDDDKVALVRVA